MKVCLQGHDIEEIFPFAFARDLHRPLIPPAQRPRTFGDDEVGHAAARRGRNNVGYLFGVAFGTAEPLKHFQSLM